MLNETLHTQSIPVAVGRNKPEAFPAEPPRSPETAKALFRPTHSRPTAPKRIQPGHKGMVPEHPWTEAQDALLKKIFGTTNLADRKQAFRLHMPKLKPHTKRAAASRAVRMGWAMPLYRRRMYWTQEQDDYLEANAHLSLKKLCQRFKKRGWERSVGAIQKRRMWLVGAAADARQDKGIYTVNEAAELLGMHRITIERFCRDGTLTADREPSNSPNLPGYVYRIKAKDLREFVIHYTAHVRIEKVDKFALVDLLCPRHGLKNPGHADTVGTAGEDDTVAKPLSLGAYA